MAYQPTRKVTVFALDPSVKARGRILRTQIEIPNEPLEPGPRGHRAFVIDYDATMDAFRPGAALRVRANLNEPAPDPFEHSSDAELLGSLDFHAMMTFAIVMKTLGRFEFALGRRVRWGFRSHHIQVAPHAFADANAFYSDRAQGLFFGYFRARNRRRPIYTCLSHEIVVHETTHALLDGLRERYTDPSSPQQAGFHEGFADIVSLLSILSAPSIVEKVVDLGVPKAPGGAIRRASVTVGALRDSGLFRLAQEMGSELAGIHGNALRRSVALLPGTDYLASGLCEEPHSCGEVLVAAVLNAYLEIWVSRLRAIGDHLKLDRARTAEEGSELADHLLNVCIRAIDYCPPTDVIFGDFASAVLTADAELNPEDSKYRLREHLYRSFVSYGIRPSSRGRSGRERGSWDPPPNPGAFVYDRTRFDSMKTDQEELSRFLWENRILFKLHRQAHTRVLSVRPCIRVGRDGFTLRETVAEYHQQLTLQASELRRLRIRRPEDMPPTTEITLYGGNAVVFDEYGHVKYNVGKSILDAERQTARLAYLWRAGAVEAGSAKARSLSRMHMRRATDWYRAVPGDTAEEEES